MTITTLIKSTMPSPIHSAVRPCRDYLQHARYKKTLRKLHINKNELLILATLTKAGTHYMRFLLANYLKMLNGITDEPVQPREIDATFPNGWHRAYLEPHDYHQPTPLLGLLGLHDFPRSHIAFRNRYWAHSRVLHLYRNPLDYGVYLYFFKYEYDRELVGTLTGPVEALDIHLDEYIHMYLSYRQASKLPSTRLISLCYEDLIRYPQVCLNAILRWLGKDPDPSHVEKAVLYSSRETTALIGSGEIWQRNGTPAANPMIPALTEQIAQEGSIGQWRKYFDDTDVQKVAAKLQKFGINLDDFVLSPKLRHE